MNLRRLLIACLALATVAMGVAFAVPAGATPPLPGERIAGGVTAAGLDVSGLTVDEAAQRLEDSYGPRLRDQHITVQAADLTFRMSAGAAKVRFDTATSAKRALYAGRQLAVAPPPAPGAPAAGVDVPLAVSFSKSAVRRFAARVARRLHREARDAKLKISIRRVRVTRSRPGRDIGATALATTVGQALVDPRATRLLKPKLKSTRAKLNADDVRKTARTVITIEQSTFTLRLFKDFKVVKRYGVAVGQPAYPTPRGRFAIQSKQVNPTWSVPNSPWAGELAGTSVTGGSAANPLKARWMGVSGSVGIHGTGQDYSIGTRASHGCIRMHVGDVIALYDRVPLGTPVLIG